VITGVLLAAGGGRRAGGPKALRRDPDGTSWLQRTIGVLIAGGCDRVLVVLGAGADRAAALATGADRVFAADWRIGMSAALHAGLEALQPTVTDAALIHLVDLPDIGEQVISRVLADGPATQPQADALARAVYDDRPGHPVLAGRRHWPGLAAASEGDRGARDYLIAQRAYRVECGDLATGRDNDARAPDTTA
jgi:CTP:molybdopterin cytidylyltransferase MocA